LVENISINNESHAISKKITFPVLLISILYF